MKHVKTLSQRKFWIGEGTTRANTRYYTAKNKSLIFNSIHLDGAGLGATEDRGGRGWKRRPPMSGQSLFGLYFKLKKPNCQANLAFLRFLPKF